MTLRYEIKFLDYWHLSSGLSAGAKLDSSVTKDSDGIPYTQGKTIKGLIKEASQKLFDEQFTNRCFGIEGREMGKCYFANATLDKNTKDEIKDNRLQNTLFEIISSTKIENGIAKDNSLREIEVVIPMCLYGEILDIPTQGDYDNLTVALKMIKRMGLNRNRGLGRCKMEVIK